MWAREMRAGARQARLYKRLTSLHATSIALQPSPDYLDASEEGCLLLIQRMDVASFMSELAEDYGLHSLTATLAINYFDRYGSALTASKRRIPRDRVQLIAMTCLLLASKFYESKRPSISDLCACSGHKYTHEELRQQELDVLRSLNWLLHVPLPQSFFKVLVRIIEIRDPDESVQASPAHLRDIHRWGSILLDLTAFEYAFLKYAPLVIALASFTICIARYELAQPGLTDSLAILVDTSRRQCSVAQAEVTECAQAIMAYYELCFPESSKAAFMPISPVRECKLAYRPETSSPQSVLMVQLTPCMPTP